MKPMPLSKPPKMTSVKASVPKVPKIVKVHIQPLTSGYKVTHIMHPKPDKQFVFHSPAKMVMHLKRLENNAWLKPGSNIAPRLTSVENLGMEA